MNDIVNLIDLICGCRLWSVSFIVNNYSFSRRSWNVKAVELCKVILLFVVFLLYHLVLASILLSKYFNFLKIIVYSKRYNEKKC